MPAIAGIDQRLAEKFLPATNRRVEIFYQLVIELVNVTVGIEQTLSDCHLCSPDFNPRSLPRESDFFLPHFLDALRTLARMHRTRQLCLQLERHLLRNQVL